METKQVIQQYPTLFTPLQQQLLSNFTSLIAIATLIGGIFVNIYILNNVQSDVEVLKQDSIKQSNNISLIMGRLGIEPQSDAGSIIQSSTALRN